jgi:hypothetical protein
MSTILKDDKKSILIDKDLHLEFKKLCVKKNYKMGGIVEKLIREMIESENK